MINHLTDRLNDAFDKRVGGTVILPSSDLLSAITCIEQQTKERDDLLAALALIAHADEWDCHEIARAAIASVKGA